MPTKTEHDCNCLNVKPNYAHWDQQPDYSLSVAAYLCCDLEPPRDIRNALHPSCVTEMERRLGDEAKPQKREFPKEKLFMRIPDFEYILTRENLEKWAEEKGIQERIPFLFHDYRKAGKDNKDSCDLSERQDKTMLKILGALLQVKYGAGIIEDLSLNRSQKVGTIHKDVTKFIEIDVDTLRKYLKRIPCYFK